MIKFSLGPYFMTIHDVDLMGFEHAGYHAENIRHLEVMKDPRRKDGRGNTKIVPVLEVKVTCHLYQYGIEIKVESMKNDRSQSWIVINRGMRKYVNELPEENGKPIHYEEVTARTERPVATNRRNNLLTPTLPSLSTMVVTIDHQKWRDILAVDYVDKGSLSFSVSKTMTRILPHRGLHRWYRCSDGLGHIVTNVMSRLRERPEMDES